MNIEFVKTDKDLLRQVVDLGTKNSKTLGHFPEGAFIEHALRGNLICAVEKGELHGYILFSVTQSKSTIRIVHLCISEDSRNQGIAKSLLDAVKDKYSYSLKGITLSCREDYKEASVFWQKYGFKAADKVRSRSKKEHYLIKWWYDFGNHDLFSLSNASSEKIKAVLDANIIIKIRDKKGSDLTGTKYLMEDWLVDQIDYYYAPEIFNEILRDNDDERAKKSRSFVRRFYAAKFNPKFRDEIFQKVDRLIPGNSENDISDKMQLSECIAGDIDYFVTNDTKILKADQGIIDLFGIQVLRPTDFILIIDQGNNKANYISTRIAGVNYDYTQLKSKEIDSLIDIFLAKEISEKTHELRSILTNIGGNLDKCQIKTVTDRSGRKIGIWACELESNSLRILLIRTVKSRLSGTLFKQLLIEAINYGRAKGKNLISVYDRYINTDGLETLEALGFILKDNIWHKMTMAGVTTSKNLFSKQLIQSILNKQRIEKFNSSEATPEFKCNVERMFWPLKFSDLDIPVYIIPIKPYWSSQLIDVYAANNTLFGAPPELAWNRENVYYRSVKPVSEISPARILWYASTSKDQYKERTNAIVGYSYLDEVHIGEAKILFQRFRHYGIYEWKDIYKQAKYDAHNIIKAIKFSDTEVFKNPISFTQVNEILSTNGRRKNTFASPLEISNDIFLKLYILGAEL